MSNTAAALLNRLGQAQGAAIAIEIISTRGSTPRGTDAFLIVTADQTGGTIGGGQLEFHAIDVARSMLAQGAPQRQLDMPLGPHLGQCCGGHVTLLLSPVDVAIAQRLRNRVNLAEQAQPEVLVFGLGHTGRALAQMLALLPFNVTLVDDRAEVFADLPQTCRWLPLDDPALAIAQALPGAAFIVLTHSHGLDYRLADAALARADAAYVGMIGSSTKRARFERWFLMRGGAAARLRDFACPIGGADVADKRPAVIASLTAAEILRAFARRAALAKAALPEIVDAVADHVFIGEQGHGTDPA